MVFFLSTCLSNWGGVCVNWAQWKTSLGSTRRAGCDLSVQAMTGRARVSLLDCNPPKSP